ncbi:methyltransferase family protein [Rhizobium sp. CF122]|uniref:class I SAM-dependent methyltransferase n=1 Tax=Rhizobium sp. CF122 TaxID=1144312 RepID=UPI0002718600|nr:class I SAM-dependent methyltransferase [Rhizobium sp. CF122]EJL58067.1 methyltransferase family protein [Rhizobium sp. CF122]
MPQCPLCKGKQTRFHARAKDIEYFTSDREFDFHHCQACDVIFIDPMLSHRLGEIYPPNYYSFKETKKNFVVATKEWLDRRALAALTRKIPGNSLSVLDIGGGTGFLLDQVKLADRRVKYTTVVDIDDGARNLALGKGHDFHLTRFEDFDPAGRSFDLVLMLNLIEHVEDPSAILKKAAGLLTPHGIIWVKTPNFDSLDARLFRNHSWAGYHTPRHFVIFNHESLQRTAAKSGLAIASFDYTQGAPFWSISVLNVLRELGLVKASASRPSIYHPLTPLLQAAGAAFDFARKPLGARLSQMVATLKRQDQ